MTCQIALVAEAERHLCEIDQWWQENRGAAPDLFLNEFQSALDLLEELPDIGPPYRHSKRPGIRRLLLTRSRYWVYYFHDRGRAIVYVLAIWSTFRGSDPELPTP
jgi:plasmid stabilization system protein ParE